MPNNKQVDYVWIAEYKDGSRLLEYKDDIQSFFKDIDEDNLKRFIVVGKNGECSVDIETGEFSIFGLNVKSNTLPLGKYRLVWFKRHRHDFSPEGEKHTVQYVFGVQTTVNEINYQQLFWIQEDGSVHINGEK